MRLVTFQREGGEPLAGAFVEGDRRIVDLAAVHASAFGKPEARLASVLSIVEAGDQGIDLAAETLKRAAPGDSFAREEVRLRAPIHPPPQMRDCMCFEKHVRQSNAATWTLFERRADAAGRPRPERGPTADMALNRFLRQPVYYKSNRFAVIGPEEDIVWPAFSKLMDFELEFGVYIKGPAKDVDVEQARDYIFGYTIFNDMSARDTQIVEMTSMLGPSKSKDFDTANPMGPCLVTADELRDPYNLTMIARVNGEEWGRGNSGDMRWKFEDLIAHITASETLHPGEFLGSGTVGDGCGLEQLRFLEPGDVIELEVQGIGVLRNRIVGPNP